MSLSNSEQIDSGLICLLLIAELHEVVADQDKIVHEYGHDKLDINKILLIAKSIGLKAKYVKQNIDRLDKTPLPAIVPLKDGNFLILAKYSDNKVLIQRNGNSPEILEISTFNEIWTNHLILVTSDLSFTNAFSNFDFTWFIPAIIKYRKLLLEVFLISLFLQLIALITPMYFQVVMDKVLVNNAMMTLNIITIGLICTIIFETLLNGIRTWIFSQTSSKIDVELGARLFRHLLNLPLAYFHNRRVGDSVARVRELENIRSFLTSNAITVILDLFFSFIFLFVMYWYSKNLTFIVIFSLPIYFLISIIFTPIIRIKLEDKFNKGADNQSFLVESISGIDTVKSMAVEPRWIQKWDNQLAGYVYASLSVVNISSIYNLLINLVNKLVTAAILYFGAKYVINNELTVGELIAFNMFASHISSPIIRMAQLWNDFQQVGISMSRLGDILNTKTEIVGDKTRIPKLNGSIRFDQVYFKYSPDSSDVLRNISFDITPGEIIGIVGRSGSGKSTITKLIQRLFVTERGRIFVDGQDISIIDTTSLRQQIGVVLQENNLFNRSIRDNIALTNPTASMELIIFVAKLAGAHDFICKLTQGYDSIIGEHGVGLSGGQRQRIAIARALISNPKILIFDEATSALDYESEYLIQKNMKDICKGRTVIIIAHRLSAVKDANRIFVINEGQLVESGSHHDLLKIENGLYNYLNNFNH